MSEYWGFDGPDYDCDPDYECSDCEEKQEVLDNASEFLEGVLMQLYGGEEFDEDILEMRLDELCSYLGVKLPDGHLKIKRKE